MGSGGANSDRVNGSLIRSYRTIVKLLVAERVPSEAVILPLPSRDPAANDVANVPSQDTVTVLVAFSVEPR